MLTGTALNVAVVGYGAIGRRRVANLDDERLVGVVDTDPRARAVAERQTRTYTDIGQLLEECHPDVLIVATPNAQIAETARIGLESGCHVLVEKPGAGSLAAFQELIDVAERVGRWLWVGYNHLFHHHVTDLLAELGSGEHGDVMFVRARYGHGGRPGYDREWRASRELAGGGELLDQGSHLLNLTYHLLGPLPVENAILRTAYWDMEVEDNAVVNLADRADPVGGPWATLQVSCTAWLNEYAVDVHCRAAHLALTGLGGSYGDPRLTINRRPPGGGVPESSVRSYGPGDKSWRREWRAFRAALERPFDKSTCTAASYSLRAVEDCYALGSSNGEDGS
ncbi:Gfo/Idh/MocA family protein [Kribbella monticola]|uniref:Gfo/Idh/MocA family protein n=1 Tax=Kribbella monticola TaxID=2185285 RepID=UPI0018E4EBB1|nr:Gfo/Idh/MocA family oxidoreductase [Kribbella monticola]